MRHYFSSFSFVQRCIATHTPKLQTAQGNQDLSPLFQTTRAARPAIRPSSEALNELKGDAALEELAAEALDDVEEAVEEAPALEPEAEVAEGEADGDDEFDPGLVALPPVLMPSAAS
jgi:hypothetical protein